MGNRVCFCNKSIDQNSQIKKMTYDVVSFAAVPIAIRPAKARATFNIRILAIGRFSKNEHTIYL